MATGAFDIYLGPNGPTAVTHPAQRQIMAALVEGERQLPELVELTGRSKPTLSGSHMKDLLNRELVVEVAHPTDSRRKIFRINARPLGSSEVPVDELRSAVQNYAKATATGLPLPAVLRCLAAAPAKAAEEVLRSQARAVGGLVADQIHGTDVREFAVSLSQFVEKHGLAQHLQLDFEAIRFRCRPGTALADVPAARLAVLLAGVAEGAAAAKGFEGFGLSWEADEGTFMLRPISFVAKRTKRS